MVFVSRFDENFLNSALDKCNTLLSSREVIAESMLMVLTFHPEHFYLLNEGLYEKD